MKYPCVGSPYCMKTFEYGHALRAHVASCVEAQKKLKSKSKIDNLENEIANEYNGIFGLHCNKFFPIYHHIDMCEKYQFKDRFRFNGKSNKPDSFNNQDILRPIRMAIKSSNMQNSMQLRQALKYQQDLD